MILSAAETIICEQGMQALKVRKIALEIGYTVGSVYMVFENMDDLMLHIKARTLDKLGLQLKQVISETNSHQNIRKLAKTYLQFANDNYHLWNMIFVHRLADDKQTPKWYQDKINALFQPIEQLLDDLKPGHYPQKKIHQAARALWGGIHGICILSLSRSLDAVGVYDVEQSVLLLVDCFINGWAQSITDNQ